MKKALLVLTILLQVTVLFAQNIPQKKILWSSKAQELLKDKKILYIERLQYAPDHHNTESLFQRSEINEQSFRGGSAMRVYDVATNQTATLVECAEGVVRDPELSYDGQTIIFSMRKNVKDDYHIYTIKTDGTELRQITFGDYLSDIDPVFLPDGDIIFSSTRQPKYCMCNRHIMANLFRMSADGSNIHQIGFSTLFEGHAVVLPDGRVMYDRWEYVDRNFGDAQALWVVNPDGTKHAIYYGNNTQSPDGVIDARPIPGTDQIVCIFGACHELPWGALAIVDRKLGYDGPDPVVFMMPAKAKGLVGDTQPQDSFKWLEYMTEDPYPINSDYFLTSRTIWIKHGGWNINDSKSGIYLMGRDGTNELLLEGNLSLFDPMIIAPTPRPAVMPTMTDHSKTTGTFYVQNVYEGTHMEGVKKGDAKYLRVVESPEKRTWSTMGWGGQGEQAPGVNWHSFEVKRILGEVPIEEDGSVSFEAPSGKHVYFQLLDKDKKMIQSMRSGVSLMPGEVNGCIGCHEDRLNFPIPQGTSLALKKSPAKITPFQGKAPANFSYIEQVQPIFDKQCLKCHDFDQNDRSKLVLARDKNPYFNASYINLYVNKTVNLVGGGSAQIRQPYSWGSHPSKLTAIIDGDHHGVKLSEKDRQTIYTWMDMNGVYYPTYETSFEGNMAGRCPLTMVEIDSLGKLLDMNFRALNTHTRTMGAQVSFDRPEKSPCLDKVRADKQKYNKALALIKLGQQRLKATPRGDIERELVVSDKMKQQLEHYVQLMKETK